jgi:PAS domain S-box-containing protein
MSAHRAKYPIRTMARVLKVSASGYYAWRSRPASARATADAGLTRHIRTIHTGSHGTYGAPRVHAELKADGLSVGRKRVSRLMRVAGIAGVSRRRSAPITTRQATGHLGSATFEEGGNQSVAFVLDLTERKHASLSAEALRRSEAHLAEAQKLSHTGAVAYNGTAILFASEETYHIWGFDPAQGLPSREVVFQRIHPGDRDWLNAEVRRAVGEKRRFSTAYRILLPDGTVKHLETIGQPVFSASGKLVEIFVTQTDVTERKRAEQALQRS